MEPRDLESVVDAELRRLPSPRAPRSLLPRVLAAVEGTRRPWYAEPWASWPRGWRAAAGAALVLAAAASALAAIGLDRAFSRIADAAPVLGAVSAVTRLVWQTLLQPAAIYALVASLALLAASAAAWRILSRVALGGAPQP